MIVTIGIPSRHDSSRTPVFWRALRHLAVPAGVTLVVDEPTHPVLAKARNLSCARALGNGSSHILHLDDDHTFGPDLLVRLLAHRVPVVSALYVARRKPFQPCLAYEVLPNGQRHMVTILPPQGGLQQVEACGAGGLLVAREVLEALDAPYFVVGQPEEGAADNAAEDFAFCRKVRAAGFPIAVDLDTRMGHALSGVVWPLCKNGQWGVEFDLGSVKVPMLYTQQAPLTPQGKGATVP